MQWARYWLECLLTVLALAFNGFRWFQATDASSPLVSASTWTTQRKLAARCVLLRLCKAFLASEIHPLVLERRLGNCGTMASIIT